MRYLNNSNNCIIRMIKFECKYKVGSQVSDIVLYVNGFPCDMAALPNDKADWLKIQVKRNMLNRYAHKIATRLLSNLEPGGHQWEVLAEALQGLPPNSCIPYLQSQMAQLEVCLQHHNDLSLRRNLRRLKDAIQYYYEELEPA